MITLELTEAQAAYVADVLSKEQERFTQDLTCVPERIFEIREVITDINDKLYEAK